MLLCLASSSLSTAFGSPDVSLSTSRLLMSPCPPRVSRDVYRAHHSAVPANAPATGRYCGVARARTGPPRGRARRFAKRSACTSVPRTGSGAASRRCFEIEDEERERERDRERERVYCEASVAFADLVLIAVPYARAAHARPSLTPCGSNYSTL